MSPPILPDGKSVATAAEAPNQYLTSSIAPATVNDPPQPRNENNRVFFTVSFKVMTIARYLANSNPVTLEVLDGIPQQPMLVLALTDTTIAQPFYTSNKLRHFELTRSAFE